MGMVKEVFSGVEVVLEGMRPSLPGPDGLKRGRQHRRTHTARIRHRGVVGTVIHDGPLGAGFQGWRWVRGERVSSPGDVPTQMESDRVGVEVTRQGGSQNALDVEPAQRASGVRVKRSEVDLEHGKVEEGERFEPGAAAQRRQVQAMEGTAADGEDGQARRAGQRRKIEGVEGAPFDGEVDQRPGRAHDAWIEVSAPAAVEGERAETGEVAQGGWVDVGMEPDFKGLQAGETGDDIEIQEPQSRIGEREASEAVA